MAIVRMISRSLDEIREFQTRSTEVGRIRIGQFATPEGKRGRPVKLDRFRLTSPTEDHIQVAAAEYGGEARPYQPQGGGRQQWEVITETDALDVWIVNGQLIDPVYEMWGAGRTCVRRCDGVWNTVLQEECLCNGPGRPADPRQLCKITTRVNVMLPRVAGAHSWRLETHSENAAVEMAAPQVAGIVRAARVPVPATLRLRKEMRRERNHEKGTFETKDFYVPWFDLSKIGSQALTAGGDRMTEALTAAGAPAVLAADRRAIEAAPVSAVPVSAPTAPPADGLDPVLLGKILADIERQTDHDGLQVIREKLETRGIDDQRVKDAWNSKRAEIMQAAALQLNDMAKRDPEGFAEALEAQPPEDREAIRQRMADATAEAVNDQFATDLDAAMGGEPVVFEGVVEDAPPPVPADGPTVAAEWPQLMTLAGKFSPPMTTNEVSKLVVDTHHLGHVGEATGRQLATVRMMLGDKLHRARAGAAG